MQTVPFLMIDQTKSSSEIQLLEMRVNYFIPKLLSYLLVQYSNGWYLY